MKQITIQIIKLINPACRMSELELHNHLNIYSPKRDLATNKDLHQIILEPHASNSYNCTEHTL